jgi:hypothetical protein
MNKEIIPPSAKIGFSIYEANGEGYSKWWSWPEGKYLGRVDETLKPTEGLNPPAK